MPSYRSYLSTDNSILLFDYYPYWLKGLIFYI